jgi:hypothetical protein
MLRVRSLPCLAAVERAYIWAFPALRPKPCNVVAPVIPPIFNFSHMMIPGSRQSGS